MMAFPLRIDAPVAAWPPVESAAAMIHVTDRRQRFGMKMLRQLLGPTYFGAALSMRGRWLIAIVCHAGIVVHATDSEDELLRLHHDVIELARHAPGHVEVFQFLDRDLRARIVADSREHALRIAPVGGTA